jgi:hypothetical protein
MKYAIANRTTGQAMPEYGTFATKQEAIDYILYVRLMPSESFLAGTGMLYITDAAALVAANPLEIKAAELIDLAKEFGLDPEVRVSGDFQVLIYYTELKTLATEITYTDKGRVSVKSWERVGRRHDSVSTKNLGDYLAYHAKRATERAERVGA